jgi:predicted HicB family RNase H-like nuclease
VVVALPVRVFSQLGVRLPADLAVRLEAFSLNAGQSLNALVAAALQRYLDQEDSVRPPD